MSTIAIPFPDLDGSTQPASLAQTVMRSAQQIWRIVNAGAAKGGNARIVIAIAAGLVSDAWALGVARFLMGVGVGLALPQSRSHRHQASSDGVQAQG
ncbi:hypothetical protein [Paraburkholderia sp. C35]|uniref:hypothetical protein n=1 Tax=Paraburkholderia sp. C35 TaxID=2126993 RepID=UPI001EF605F1|nr:hypothetical protein [Paraburkholderia sp. C35]